MANNVQQQVKININSLNALETVACPNCNNFIFKTNLSIFKKLPSIQSPTGHSQLIRIDLISCPACNRFFQIKDDELLPVILKELEKESDSKFLEEQ